MSAPISIIPLPYPSPPQDYAQKLSQLDGFVWLDSSLQSPYGNSLDIVTALPYATFTPSHPQQAQAWQKNQLQQLHHTGLQALPFTGGIVGYMHYPESGLGSQAHTHLAAYAWALVQNHQQQQCQLVFHTSCPQSTQQHILHCLQGPTPALKPYHCSPFTAHTSAQAYKHKVQQALDYIRAGDAYQINLSQCFSAQFSGCAFSAYLALRQACPAPYSAYMRTAEGALLSLSPEQFIGISQNKAITRPIKGTIKRSSQPKEDTNLAQALSQSPKNLAENLMIVDLLRNDFSQNCKPHSVKTPHLFQRFSFANVHHLISTVTGELLPNVTPWDFFTRCFPGGSITGAPKKRAMEIIQELETSPRDIYCGTIFYHSSNGHFDSSITIRTLQLQHNQLKVWGGGGIVADSQPQEEYEESLQKIALLQTTLLRYSQE